MKTPAEVNRTHPPLDALDPDTRAVLRRAHRACIARRELPVWCVTFNPSDLPGLYVARLHVAANSGADFVTTIAATGTTLDAVRQALPVGLIRMPRHPDDQPHIVESWL